MRKTIIIIMVLISCMVNSNTKLNPLQSDKDKIMCFGLLEKIVTTSDYDILFKKRHKKKIAYVIKIEEASKRKVTIQVLLKSTIDPNVPMGWLELDLVKNQLRDITANPDQPVILKFDMNLLKQFKNSCLKYCLD